MKKWVVAISVAILLVMSFSVGVFAASKIKLVVNGTTAGKVDMRLINGTYYAPVKDIASLLEAKVSFDSKSQIMTLVGKNYNGTKQQGASSQTTNDIDKMVLDSGAMIQKYLNGKYSKFSPIKTLLADVPFKIRVTSNDSKNNAYDYLISFDCDMLGFNSILFERQNSIKYSATAQEDTVKASGQLTDFIEKMAKDIISKLPSKKFKGETDNSYYRYPNIKEDYIVVLNNVWANYDFTGDALFMDYYSPLVNYDETVLSDFRWAPPQE